MVKIIGRHNLSADQKVVPKKINCLQNAINSLKIALLLHFAQAIACILDEFRYSVGIGSNFYDEFRGPALNAPG